MQFLKTSSLWARAVPLLMVCLPIASVLAAADQPALPNLQKVSEMVYRGGQPTDEGIEQLAKMGMKTIVDLRDIGEHSQAAEEKLVKAEGMRYLSVPMKGLHAPADLQISNLMAIMDDSTQGPVFIHCRRGADRTGTVIACYRIAHDHWENQAALKEARGYGMSWIERAMQSYVMHYRPPSPATIGPLVGVSLQPGPATAPISINPN